MQKWDVCYNKHNKLFYGTKSGNYDKEWMVIWEKKLRFAGVEAARTKLGAGILSRVLERLPKGPEDPNLLIGYDSKDDAAVYKVSDDIAIVQTLDFFPPMVEDPYTFGKIAATNCPQ